MASGARPTTIRVRGGFAERDVGSRKGGLSTHGSRSHGVVGRAARNGIGSPQLTGMLLGTVRGISAIESQVTLVLRVLVPSRLFRMMNRALFDGIVMVSS